MDRETFGTPVTGVFRIVMLICAGFWLGACASTKGYEAPRPASAQSGKRVPGTMKPYQINGRWYYPAEQPRYNEVGIASWYGGHHQGRPTANGEIFDTRLVTAAHKTLPLPCLVEVTNLDNGRKLKLRVNDRGPFVDGRIIDLSKEAADRLGVVAKGTAKVRVRYLGPAEPIRLARRN